MLRPGDFVVWSKRDLGGAVGPSPPGLFAVSVSAVSGEGIGDLLAALTAAAAALAGGSEAASLTRKRHALAVEAAITALGRAREAAGAELAAEDVRLAARSLAAITGEIGVEDVLDEIFASFCIGK